jgi:3'(2'), 5'-bisphosphate nucleotidase
MKNLQKLSEIAINISNEAAKIILDIYYQKDQEIKYKKDNSPITIADQKSSDHICKELKNQTNIPVISEEEYITYEQRKNYEFFWLIDPLDGTKEFINKNDEFSINIALIYNNKPIIGLINIPTKKEIYYAIKNQGAYLLKDNNKLKLPIYHNIELISATSRYHKTEETENFLIKNNINKTKIIGAALKFCYLAKGSITIYPRFVGSKEWDIAAGHLIITEANCKIIDIKTKAEPTYNKKILKNNFFIAYSKNLDLANYFSDISPIP